MKKITILSFGAFVIFLAGIGTASLFNKPSTTEPATQQFETTEIHKMGKLTSPLLECNISKSVMANTFVTFENDLRNHITQSIKAKKIIHASVYFRRLLDGGWLGINETEKFTPASLLKVPNMIALLKESETDPNLLTKKLMYQKKYFEGTPFYEPEKQLQINKSYEVDDLITRMVVYSDNESMFLLRDNFDSEIFNKLYADLGITEPDDTISDDFMTVKTYASFFRILFNASYLSVPMSEKALTLLTKISYDKGIVSGVPEGIIVAHKFGERTYNNETEKQLHDCGIIYQPGNPYLLCIMTRGTDFETLSDVIKELSSSVWNEMQNLKKSN